MENAFQNLVPVIEYFSSAIFVVIAVIGVLWRIPSKGDMSKMEERLSARMDRQDVKSEQIRSELRTEIKTVEEKVDKLDEKLDDTASELRLEIKAVEAKVDKTNENHLELHGDVKALTRDVAALTDKTSRIERDLEVTRNATT